MKPRRKRKPTAFSFTLMDELMANPEKPVPEFRIEAHLRRVRAGLQALLRDEQPSLESWRDLSDAINILSAAAELGIVQDTSGECDKAKNAMGEAGDRHMLTGTIRLSGPGAKCLMALLDDYAEVAGAMSERDFIRSCRHAERRVREVLAGRHQAGDRVVAL